MSSLHSESEEHKSVVTRLGECEVCGGKDAVYTCPKCEVKTCCLSCVRIHKKELDCDGARDRTKFIRIKDFTDTDLLSDYRMLEECARFTYGVKRNKDKWSTWIERELPARLYKLKMTARSRGIVLQFLTYNFTRRSINTTRFIHQTKLIHWRVEWIFPNAEPDPVKFSDEQCPENQKLSKLIEKYLSLNAEPFEGSNKLTYYRSVGMSRISTLLKAEKVAGSSHKYFELDPSETLAENLSGKCIIEFPIIFVVLKDHAFNFDIIVSDEESEEETIEKEETKPNSTEIFEPNTNNIASTTNNHENNSQTNNRPVKRHRELLTEKIAKEKKLEIQKEIKEAKKRKPKNLLFTTGYSSEEDLVDSGSDDDK